MKQHITPTQASEVTFDEFQKIYMDTVVKRDDWAKFHSGKMTIGRLIQFIGDKCKGFEILVNGFGYEIHVNATTPFDVFTTDHYTNGLGVRDGELIDVLWRIAKQMIGKRAG